jgi:hypothetical protein
VVITTQGRLQMATIAADKNGIFSIKGIDPGVYRIYAASGKISSPDKLLVLKTGMKKKLTIELTEEIKPVKIQRKK